MSRPIPKTTIDQPAVELPFCSVTPPFAEGPTLDTSYRMIVPRSRSKPPSNPGTLPPGPPVPSPRSSDPGVYIHVAGTPSEPPREDSAPRPSSRPPGPLSGVRRTRSG
jgi:hypothetical protein